MFGQALSSLGTPEQQTEWLDRALKCKIWGTYVQTEVINPTSCNNHLFIRNLHSDSLAMELSYEALKPLPAMTRKQENS